MKLLNEYFDIQKKIYDYFGYIEDWKVIPIDDGTDYFWMLKCDKVCFADTKQELLTEDGNYYENEILPMSKSIYHSKEYTMICVDPRTDGNQFLQIFDNSKELK